MARRWFPGVYEGWIVVGSSALVVLMIGATFYYGFSVIFNDIIREFGWSVAATAFAFSLRSEIGGLAAPFVGYGIDRLGARRIVLGGVYIAAAGVLAMSYTQNIWQFDLAMIVIAIGSSGAGGQAGLAAIATWFERRRSAAMSVSTLGGGLGGVAVIGIAWLVEEWGWRIALRCLVVAMIVVGTAFGLLIRTRPADHPQPMDGRDYHDADGAVIPRALVWGIPARRVVTSTSFIFASLAMIALAFSTTAVLVHQVPFLESRLGVSKAVAGSTVAIYTTSSIIGRLGLGMLGDVVPKRVLLAICALLIGTGGIVLALATTFTQVVIAILLIGPGFGGTIPVRSAMVADYFGVKYFGTVNGIAALMNTTGGALGPWAVGRIVDVTGAYTAGWFLAGAVGFVAAPLALLALPPRTLADEYRALAAEEDDGTTVALPILAE